MNVLDLDAISRRHEVAKLKVTTLEGDDALDDIPKLVRRVHQLEAALHLILSAEPTNPEACIPTLNGIKQMAQIALGRT